MTDILTEVTVVLGAVITILSVLSSHSKLASRIDAVLTKVAPDVPQIVQTAEKVAEDVASA